MKCAQCDKTLQQQTIATKTRKQGGHVVVLASRQALVCSEHGVIAWDPYQQVINVPYVNPFPRPWSGPYTIPTIQPNTNPYPGVTWQGKQYASGTGGVFCNEQTAALTTGKAS